MHRPCISNNVDLLDKKTILQHLNAKHSIAMEQLEILDITSSTNDHLAKINNPKREVRICLAEMQTAGRGRLRKKWFSPYARNIYLSMSWYFVMESGQLSGLSLAVAVATVKTLAQYGIVRGLRIKWPNDILWNDRKLAGILIETAGESSGFCRAIIGIGLNIYMPDNPDIEQAWCDISQIIGKIPNRSLLASLLLNNLCTTLIIFQRRGLKPFIKKWHRLDYTRNKQITIISPRGEKISGIGQGIDEQGSLLLKDKSENIRRITCGEVSLKMANI